MLDRGAHAPDGQGILGWRLGNAGHAFRALAPAACSVTPPRWVGRDPVPSWPGSLYTRSFYLTGDGAGCE